MSRHIHFCCSVRGVLHKTDRQLKRELGGCVHDDTGRVLYDAQSIRTLFEDELAKGHEVVKCGECDNFDYKTGCRGHETPNEPEGGDRG